jgi:hypothetical protein
MLMVKVDRDSHMFSWGISRDCSELLVMMKRALLSCVVLWLVLSTTTTVSLAIRSSNQLIVSLLKRRGSIPGPNGLSSQEGV